MATEATTREVIAALDCAWRWGLDPPDLAALTRLCASGWAAIPDANLTEICRDLANESAHKPYPNNIRELVLARAATRGAATQHNRARALGECSACGAKITSTSGECSACQTCWSCEARSREYASGLECPACGESPSARPHRHLWAEVEALIARRNKQTPEPPQP